MKMNSQRTSLGFLILCILVYVTAIGAYTYWSNREAKRWIIQELDKRLLMAARSLKYMLSPDFHDRAVDRDSISYDEELKNRAAVSGYARETEFQWLYTLVENNGKYYFSAPTVSEKEARERKVWYFYPYEDIPESFVEAFRKKGPVYVEYTDQWGKFRSVALPQVSPGGRVYLACADLDISFLAGLLRVNLIRSLLTALFFLLLSLPFLWFTRRLYRSHNAELETINKELTVHRDHLEELVRNRTSELKWKNDQLQEEIEERKRMEEALQVEKGKLQKALAEVKKLGGLLPICASCKKIRDDKGYWSQIEGYLQDHSDVEFSHSLCPECAKILYPDFVKPEGY